MARARYIHQQRSSLNDNLLTLLFIVASELNENQRFSLTSNLANKSMTIDNYTWDVVLWTDLFCSTQTSTEDPSIRKRSEHRGARTYCIIEELGECDGSYGYWAQDDEDGAEGFLDEIEDEFWIFDDEYNCWAARQFKGRRLRRGKLRRAKGRGRGGKRRFRPGIRRRRGRPYATEGLPHIEEDWSNSDWYPDHGDYHAGNADAIKGKRKGRKGKGFKGGKSKGQFSKGGKGKGKGKGKGGKGEGKSKDKADANSIPAECPFSSRC